MSFETPLPPYNASDPHATFLNASCLDLLLIELVPMAHRIASEPPVHLKDGEKLLEEEEQKEAAFRRLESLGYRVGQGLVERWVLIPKAIRNTQMLLMSLDTCRFSRDRPRFTDPLDVIKFLCKDLRTLVFRKQIDNLKTNHRVCSIMVRYNRRS